MYLYIYKVAACEEYHDGLYVVAAESDERARELMLEHARMEYEKDGSDFNRCSYNPLLDFYMTEAEAEASPRCNGYDDPVRKTWRGPRWVYQTMLTVAFGTLEGVVAYAEHEG